MRRFPELGRRAVLLLVVGAIASTVPLAAQRGRGTTSKPKPKPVPPVTVAPTVSCPEQLGTGVRTHATFCFVLAGRNTSDGVLIAVPPHTGDATLTFDLHNRHSFSEEEVKAGRGFARYTAVIGVLTMTGELLGRGAVQAEFRTARDLYDRVTGGAGPGGMKAVAPLGREEISTAIPANVDQVSLLGEVLDAVTPAGKEVATPGRPVAIISNVQLTYVPAPPPRRR